MESGEMFYDDDNIILKIKMLSYNYHNAIYY